MERKSWITAVAIAGVLLAGAAAVGANLGILDAANNGGELGKLSAAGDLAPAGTQVVDVYLDQPAGSPVPVTVEQPAAAQQYTVDTAGTVAVVSSAGGLRLGDVTTEPGWTWTSSQTANATLAVSFSSAARTVTFTATVAPDGTINASVDEPPMANPVEDSHDDHGGGGDDD